MGDLQISEEIFFEIFGFCHCYSSKEMKERKRVVSAEMVTESAAPVLGPLSSCPPIETRYEEDSSEVESFWSCEGECELKIRWRQHNFPFDFSAKTALRPPQARFLRLACS